MAKSGIRSIVKGAWREFVGDSKIKVLPSLLPFRGYGASGIKSDLIAGVNVALLGLPQGMAYAAVAGVDIVYGIVSAILAAVIGTFFAASRFTVFGPTNATAFMIYSFFVTYPTLLAQEGELMPILSLMIGVVMIVGGFLRAADLGQYISRSVIVGYLTGAAILIMIGQIKHLFGVSLIPEGGTLADTPKSLFSMVWRLIHALPQFSWEPMTLGCVTIAAYLWLSRKFAKLPVFGLVLVASCTLSFVLSNYLPGFAEIARYQSFVPSDLIPSAPDISVNSYADMFAPLFGLALAVAFLASLEGAMMSKSLASRSGDKVDVNQDLYGLGVANVACAIGGGMPSSASLTRSVLNFQSGARTAIASAIGGLVCLLGALALSSLVGWIPKASLAALVIGVAVSLINRKNIRICLGATKSDAITLIVTFGSTMVMPLHVAIFVGVATSVILYLRKAARPELVQYDFTDDGNLAKSKKRRIPAISIVHVEGDLFFAAAELFRNQVQRTLHDENLKVIILRLRNARNLDATSVMALAELVQEVKLAKRFLLVSGSTKDVYKVLKNSGMVEVIGRDNIFPGSPENPNIATRNALLRAQELLGTKEADIQIFIDKNKSRSDEEKG